MSNKVRRIFSKAVNLITSATAQGLSKGELGSPDTPEEMKSIARIAAEEGIVMLKNNGVLPIEKDENVCIFGRIQRDYFFVGYGSGGDVNKPYCVDLVDGMKNAGIKVDEQIEKIYSDWIKNNPADDGFWGAWPRYHDEMKIDEKTVADAAKRSSCAVVVIGRSAGEDRENTLKKGSYYLTDDETALLDKVTANFKNTVVLINSGNIIDMSWMNKYGDKLGALLYVWQGGMESGNAIGEVLSGRVSPSGKLPDTIADCYESYPAAKNFGKKTYNNYAEDIFVGYRYFETFAPEKVMFPFGFGLSYTSFELSDKTVMEADDRIIVSVKVRNVGSVAGKEVIEVYYGAPQGELGKAAKSLAAYEKTRTLLPGEEQRVVVSFPCANMASFDDSGKSGAAFCYVLEAGDLILVPSGCIHRPEIAPGAPYERIILYISPEFLRTAGTPDCDLEACFAKAQAEFMFVLRPGAERRVLLGALLALEREQPSQAFGKALLERALVLQFLIGVRRGMEENRLEAIRSTACDEKVVAILQYLSAHLTEELSIDELAGQFYISKYHMMRRFKEETGYTIHNYVVTKRLMLARDRISAGVPVGEACYACGFRDYSAFARAYKKLFSASPRSAK